MMELEKILQKEGLGTRRFCRQLIQSGKVWVENNLCLHPTALFSQKNLRLTVENQTFWTKEYVVLALNKPVGFECSQNAFHAGIFSLIPKRFCNRGVQPIGRLDVNTSGLIFLTDNGKLNHFLTSPKNQIPRVYVAECAENITEHLLIKLQKGVFLKNEQKKSIAQHAQKLNEKTLKLTLTGGKYHEVRRMIAALGNHVVQLKRIAYGNFQLPENLAEGAFELIDSSRILHHDDFK